MQLATAMNLRKAMDEETKRERFASWYSTLPGIPAHEKEIIERSLKYNVWKELIKLFVVYMIPHAYLSLPGTVSEPFAIHSKKAILLTLISLPLRNAGKPGVCTSS